MDRSHKLRAMNCSIAIIRCQGLNSPIFIIMRILHMVIHALHCLLVKPIPANKLDGQLTALYTYPAESVTVVTLSCTFERKMEVR